MSKGNPRDKYWEDVTLRGFLKEFTYPLLGLAGS
jgi:hypothetical protein